MEQKIPKKTYSYNDLIRMESDQAYTSIGTMISSRKPTAPRATFGKFERSKASRQLLDKELMRMQSGKDGQGPATYLPSSYYDANGDVLARPDIDSNLKYNSAPHYSIGKSPRKGQQNPVYNYMDNRNDQMQLNEPDIKRRNSQPVVRIGTEKRFASLRADAITPGPTYDPKLKPDLEEAPKYTIGVRRSVKGVDPLVPNISTDPLVGPSSYFKRGTKSLSTASLNRVPYGSKTRNEPAISFAKGPKSLATFKNTIDQTYDIKTKTIMAHYDFEYDAGKGYNSGRAWDKRNIISSSQMPLEKNRMKSFTISRSSREKQQKRGNFVSTMSFTPTPVRINHPKF